MNPGQEHTDGLSDELLSDMNNELTKAYLGGLIDGCGSLNIAIKKDAEYSFGYHLEPDFHLTKSRPHSIQILDNWTAHNGIYGSANHYNDRYSFRMNRVGDITRFLELLQPYIQDRGEQVDMMLNELLPKLEDKYQRESKANFIEMVEIIERLRKVNIHSKSSKYDADYFRELWADELGELQS